MHARLCLALRSFFHPAAGRELLWNLRATPRLRPLLDGDRGSGTAGARRARRSTATRSACCRSGSACAARSCTATSTSTTSCSTSAAGSAGILDFGDCCHTALAADLAVALASFLRGRPPEDAFRVARIALDGFASRLPLEPLELELLGDLVAARLAAIVSISAWRSRRFPENAAYIEAWDDDSWRLLELLDGLAPEEVARELGARRAAGREPGARAAAERGARRAPDAAHLRAPRPRVRAEGVWIHEPDGQPAPRRLQQRPGRRALPPAGDRGGRPPDAARRDQRALPRRAARRARRAAARDVPAGGGPRHGAARQLRQRGERPRLAARGRRDRARRRARDRERLPRSHRGDDRALAGGLAGRATAGPRRPHSPAGQRRRPRRARSTELDGRSRRDVPRRVAHERRDLRARELGAPPARGADARRRRALRRGRGAGGPRPARAGASGRSRGTASRPTS